VQEFIPGQRWVSDTESQMGLGTVLTTDHRCVTIVFLATGQTRTYAKATAPLTRGSFEAGDVIKSHEGWNLTVKSSENHAGLRTYHGVNDEGENASLEEGQLDNFIQLNRPSDRLFMGQIDPDKWFNLRYKTHLQQQKLTSSPVRGLAGSRTTLIPHQLYIAHEVANRFAPRVLLADEVGLGKTIEAGLILHHQLLTELAKRVLIIVPESLVHQWLVEMLRRFNLRFSVFDEERCLADEESTPDINPFETEQLALCSIDYLANNPKRFQQALDGDWDLLVIDEAHHLQWSEDQPSQEYQLVEQLARNIQGVLLLTATPEQLGKASHFARLRLLDPDRFPSYENFLEEEESYEPVADAIESLLSETTLPESALQTLSDTLDEGDNQRWLDVIRNEDSDSEARVQAQEELVKHLLDRHGTGRVLFRNTRNTIKGFPERLAHAYELAMPETYAGVLNEFQSAGLSQPKLLLYPETLYQAMNDGEEHSNWLDVDTRVPWLKEKLKDLKPNKVLVITSSAQTALDLADYLRIKSGIHASVFHEGMNIIERDRAAAYFADLEYGTQVLICSEIGSEGRNFQFAHHLILFDMPLNPDLLEQRIGRLDRIGQTQTINIHVPYIKGSAQEIMFHWYHEGLNAFEHTCPVGHEVFTQVKDTLVESLHQLDEGIESLDALVTTSRQLRDNLYDALNRGRDRLLEKNSCRPTEANQLRTLAEEQDEDPQIKEYMDAIFDCYGVDSEPHGDKSDIIRPSEHLQTSFPGLPDDGLIITSDRDTALSNENMQFLTWEHPMVTDAMDMVVSSELGNTSMAALKTKAIKPGTLLAEAIFILESMAKTELQTRRYLPATSVRVIIDEKGHDYSGSLRHRLLSSVLQPVDSETANKIAKGQIAKLKSIIKLSEAVAQKQAPKIIEEAHLKAKESLESEINRLNALRQINPNVRDDEIKFFTTQLEGLTEAVGSAKLRLDGIRIIITI